MFDFHWPAPCAVCTLWTRKGVCADCVCQFAPSDRRCGRCAGRADGFGDVCGRCDATPPPVEGSVAALDYGFPWDRLILAYKFGHRPELAGLLARPMMTAVCAHPHHGKDAVDALVPVPLWPGRLAERGYNQSWELARCLSLWTGKPARPDILRRTRATAVQSLLKVSERSANIRGAFAATPAARRWIAGRRIALVDDVMTSGATAFEAARVLRDSGAAEVRLWVLARAHGLPHDP